MGDAGRPGAGEAASSGVWRRSSNEYSHLVNGERKRVDPRWIDITSMVVHSHHQDWDLIMQP